mmetsp:Transcript_26770/g.56048  ORF Transcript_26770/g.56048 Transcript_26770/m.56048 type:complete len:442 (+) Transcript_26770:87-1412(+)
MGGRNIRKKKIFPVDTLQFRTAHAVRKIKRSKEEKGGEQAVSNVQHLVEHIDAVQVLGGLAQTVSHGFFSGAEHHTRIVVLLVGLVVTIGVSDLSLQVFTVFGFVSADTVPVGPLGVGINVHLDDTGFNGVLDIFDGRSRTSVENKEHGLVFVASELFLHVSLGVVENDGLEINVSRGVDTVDVSEGSGASEGSTFDLAQLFVSVHDFFGLSVKTRRVDISVINTVFFSSSDTQFEFEQDVHLGEFFHVFLANGNVFFQRFFGKIKHVRRKEGFSVLFKVFLVGGNKTVHPWQPSLLAMVSVQNDGHTVKFGDLTHVKGSGDGSSNGGLIVGVVSGLSGNELTTSLGESDHDGSSVLGGGFHTGVDGVGSNNVDSGNGVSLGLGISQKIDKSSSSDNTRLDGSRKLGESLQIDIASKIPNKIWCRNRNREKDRRRRAQSQI